MLNRHIALSLTGISLLAASFVVAELVSAQEIKVVVDSPVTQRLSSKQNGATTATDQGIRCAGASGTKPGQRCAWVPMT